jgi:hypothetical protein
MRASGDPRFSGCPMVLETPKPAAEADRINLAILRALHGRRRVGPRARRLVTELAALADRHGARTRAARRRAPGRARAPGRRG